MEETAEQVASMHSALLLVANDRQPAGLIWRLKHQRPVGPVVVVVPDVDAKDLLQMASAHDQQPVQALGADRPHPALRERVRPGRLHGRQQHLGTLGAEHIAEVATELRVSIVQQESAGVVSAPPARATGCEPAG
jgi:hypothetical protein